MATKIQPQNRIEEFNKWAKEFNVSTLWDADKFENREFIKRLDEARFFYENKKKQK